MESLKEKILTEGEAIGTEIVKVDGFLNHQIDVKFLEEIGEEFKRRFDDIEVDKILTVEASGIAIACMAAPLFGYPPSAPGNPAMSGTPPYIFAVPALFPASPLSPYRKAVLPPAPA